MESGQQMVHFYIGGGVGLASAFVGGLLQYRISRKNRNSATNTLPGCMLIISGFLGFIGLIMAAFSLILTGSLKLAIAPGAGVLAGFFTGFVIMLMAWLLKSIRR